MNPYKDLSEYYKQLFSQIDYYLFNSSISSNVYSKELDEVKGTILPVVLSSISDNRKEKTFDCENIKLAFIGNTSPYKGYPLLESVLTELLNENISNWTLSVWGGSEHQHPKCSNIQFRGKYGANDLEQIYAQTDLLIVPSIWKETFSLITLEALSHGVPVLVSSTVGARDIVKQYDESFIFETKINLKEKLILLLSDTLYLSSFNSKILDNPWIYDHKSHADQVHLIYEQLINKQI